MKKIIACFVAFIIVCSVATFPVSANGVICSESQSVSEARANETVWYTRVYNGVLQKRLWSVTYNCWLTDWIDC